MDETAKAAASEGPRYVRTKRSLLNRFGRRIRHPLSRFFRWQSTVGASPVMPANRFPGLTEMISHFPEMQYEARRVLQERTAIPPLGEVSPDHRRIASDGNWKSLFLHGYGYDADWNRERCPTIAKAIDEVPDVVTAFLSIMEPGTYVPRHRGLTTAWVNCHLPLVLPQGGGRCEIAIDDEIHRWHEGEWLVFDDTYYHEVWNETEEPRLVLLMQVRRPMRPVGKALAWAIYHILRRSHFVQDVRRKLTRDKR